MKDLEKHNFSIDESIDPDYLRKGEELDATHKELFDSSCNSDRNREENMNDHQLIFRNNESTNKDEINEESGSDSFQIFQNKVSSQTIVF